MSSFNVFGMIESDRNAWMRPYVDFDRVTFPDDVRDALASANPNEDLEITVDSPGGYVDGGRSMIVAVQDWCRQHGRKANITIGGMACSMAAAFALSFTGKIRVHTASLMMVHGARVSVSDTYVSREFRDMADSLDTINKYMIDAIAKRTGKTTDEAKALIDGTRESYFGGADIVAAGLADEVLDGELPADAEKHVPNAAGIQAMSKHLNTAGSDKLDAGVALAAVACAAYAAKTKKGNIMDKKTPAPTAEAPKKEPTAPTAEAPKEEPTAPTAEAPKKEPTAPTAEAPKEESAPSDATADAIKSAVADAVAAAVAPLKAEIESLTKAKAAADAARAAAEGQLAGLRRSGIEKAMTPPVENSAATAAETRRNNLVAWREAVQACAGDLAKAKSAHPDLYTAVCAAK